MKKAIGYGLILFAVLEVYSPEWWTNIKEEIGKKIEEAKAK